MSGECNIITGYKGIATSGWAGVARLVYWIGCALGDRGIFFFFSSVQGGRFFLKIRSSHFFLVSTKHPIQCVTGAHLLAVIGCGVRVTGHLPPRTEVKSSWRYTCTYSYVLMECCLIKEKDNFTYLPHYIPVTCRRVHIFLFHTHKGTRANTQAFLDVWLLPFLLHSWTHAYGDGGNSI